MKLLRSSIARLRFRPWRLLTVVSVVTFGCARHDDDAGCEPFWADVHTVEQDPADGGTPIALEEVWRVGGSNAGQEIAEPASVTISRTGYSAVVDFALGEVNVISPSGEWLGQWARRGRGPGELTMPVAANWAGDTLVVYDIEQSKIARYHNGEALADARIPPELSSAVAASGVIDYVAVRSDGTVILRQPLQGRPDSDSSHLTVLQATPESPPDTLVTARVQHVVWEHGAMAHPAGAMPRIAVGPDNRFALSANDGSRRILFGQGSTTRQLCATVPALPLSADEQGRGTAPQGFETAFHALGAAEPPRDRSAVGRMLIGGDGALWIDPRRPRAFTREVLLGVPGGSWELYGEDGEHGGTVNVPAAVALQAVGDSMAVGLEFTEMDEVWVIGYRLVLQ